MSDVSYHIPGPSSQPTSVAARESLKIVVAAVVKGQGYDGIDASALDCILNSVESLLYSLPAHAHALATMSNRRIPSTRDVFTALQFTGPRLRQAELEQHLRDTDLDELVWQTDSKAYKTRPAWTDPIEKFLPSESEDDSAVEEEAKETGVIGTRSKVAKSTSVRKRRRKKFKVEMAEVPRHFPPLPPKHTWLSSPSYPAHSINLQPPLAFLDRKVSSNRLMEASLRGLIRATDAAVLDSQLQSSSLHSIGRGVDSYFDSEVVGSVRGLADDRPAASPQQSNTATPTKDTNMTTTTSDNYGEDSLRSKVRKGRTLSLRLRTPSTSQAVPQPLAIISAEASSPSTTFKRPLGMGHRPSASTSGPQSILLPNLQSHMRRNTFASGPWSAGLQQQSQGRWGSATSKIDTMSPLSTPRTPGMDFYNLATPSEAHFSDVLSLEAGRQREDTGSAAIGLPTTVNYKRTWYKKSSSSSSSNKSSSANILASQKRIKS
ncbi:hypothetical protein CBS101457_006076 [Exobasidium rhododendri]|nr:hypothetical protein CBS101457_006076 [Exobasidium rhododendri]